MKNNEIAEKIISGEMSVDDVVKEMDSLNLGNVVAFKLDVKFKNESDNEDPKYAKEGDSGFDLRANLSGSITLGSLERALVPTGLYFELPPNFELQVRPRSGLAAKNGVTVLNTPGTVDNLYRGELKVILVNLSKDEFTVNHGDRIAQAVISPVTNDNVLILNKVDEISLETDRGSDGFGSTGVS
jgi:dUTP pyrophosphatase